MDLLDALKISVSPKQWVKYPNTNFEVLISKLSTVEIQRLTKSATKRNRLNTERLLELSYRKIIHGIRGLTLETLEKTFGIIFPESVTKDGSTVAKDAVITSEPIEDYWKEFLIGLGKACPMFHLWLQEKSGLSDLAEEEYEEELEKKTL